MEQLARVGSVWLIYQYTLEKGMELTAFHAVAGLVAGECSGLITSLIAMSLEKRLPGHSYHTLSGQWKTMGKLFASMAVPLTINRVTTALFNSLENLLIPQKLQAFGYSASDALSIFGILTGMTMSIILFPSVLTNSFSVLLLPAVSEAHSAHNHAQIARTIKKQSCTDCFLALFLRFCFWFSVTGWAKFCFTIRWPAILSASSPGCVPCCMSPVC